ncbi:MAG: GyrI-like domain-containing protein [Bryobacteraceae bacterium]
MTKLDLYRKHKAEYVTPEQTEVIAVGPAQYLAIEGKGAPGSEAFQSAIGALYNVAFTLKMKLKAKQDYMVCKLEGQYGVDQKNFAEAPQETWQWRLLIRTPDFVTNKEVAKVIETLIAKGKPAEVANVKLMKINEGCCLQALHTGPYTSEPVTIEAMLKRAAEEGYSLAGLHHEIYLSDPRRVPPEKLRTILRLPVTKN